MKKFWILLFTVSLIIGFSVGFFTGESNEVIDPVTPEIIEPTPEPEPEPEPTSTSATIVGVGDNLIHSAIYRQASERSDDGTYDFTFAYQEIADYIASFDISSINQETLMSPDYAPSTYPTFNSPVELGEEMLEIGFDVFNVATNHSLDKTSYGLRSALTYWQAYENMTMVGAYLNEEDYSNIRTITTNDITFAFLGMTEATNGLTLPDDTDLILVQLDDLEELESRIKAAAEISDVVVINVHWGSEYVTTPNSFQTELAAKMIEWGADIIFGHHPHVLQPIEIIERTDGTEGIVIYSLGNFISAQSEGMRMLGGALEVTVEKDYETGITTITDYNFTPVVTHYGTDFENIQVMLLEDYTEELADSHGVKVNTPEFSLEYLENLVENIMQF